MDQIGAIDDGVERLERAPKDVKITDHAILRYLERVKGLDLRKICEELLPSSVEKQIRKVGCAGVYPVSKSHKLRVQNNAIVTVLSMDMK